MLDVDAFEERAAIMEFCGGLSRFEAETLAAQAQGYSRHEVMNEIRERHNEQARHPHESADGHTSHHLPGVQSRPQEENRPMPERELQAGRGGLDVLALRMERG